MKLAPSRPRDAPSCGGRDDLFLLRCATPRLDRRTNRRRQFAHLVVLEAQKLLAASALDKSSVVSQPQVAGGRGQTMKVRFVGVLVAVPGGIAEDNGRILRDLVLRDKIQPDRFKQAVTYEEG